jgi:putative membrane protein
MTASPGLSEDETAPVPDADEPTWRRLNARMLVIHPTHELLRSSPLIIGSAIAGANGSVGWSWPVAITLGALWIGIMRWLTTTYRTTSEQVLVRRGLFRRRVLSVPRDRVRTVDVSADVLHRMLGVALVNIGTGRSGRQDKGLKLDALLADEAKRLADDLLVRDTAQVEITETELTRLRPVWRLYSPFMLSGVVAVGVLTFLLSPIVFELHVDPDSIPPLRALLHEIAWLPLPLAGLEVVLLVWFVIGLASAIGYSLSFYGFRVTRRSNGTLRVSHGLLARRVTTLEERRIHGADVIEPLLVRLFRGARVNAIATGLQKGNQAERSAAMLVPPAPRDEVMRVTGELIRRPAALNRPLTGHGPKAHRRRYTRALVLSVLFVAAIGVVQWQADLPWWSTVIALPVLPAAALLAEDRYRALGHTIADGALIARHRSLFRRRYVLACDGIIGWNVRRSFFQRRVGLTSLIAATAAGKQKYPVQDTPLGEALRVADEAIPDLLTPFLAVPARELP